MTSQASPLPVIQMAGITKSFPGVVANDDISLAIWEGTIHAIIGENGAGKSTLMGILYGRYQPDRGRIRVRGEDVCIDSPAAAIRLGIGMVTQHTTMIPALSVLDNIVLGAEPGAAGIIDRTAALARVRQFADKLGIEVEWPRPAGELSVAALQKAEVVKALYRGASILILDEPSATLAPQESDALFALLHGLADSGATVILITHKLREVMEHSSRVTVLRRGKMAGERETSQTDPDELLRLMLGQRAAAPGITGFDATSEYLTPGVMPAYLVGSQPATSAAPPIPTLEIRAASVMNDRRALAVRDVSLDIAPGEVVGVAGVDGSGQRELAEGIVGLRPMAGGEIRLEGEEIGRQSVGDRVRRGLAFVPEDRHREGLVLDMTIAENLLLGRERDPRSGGGAFIDLRAMRWRGDTTVREHQIRAPGAGVVARSLSGGNQQKVVIARALESEPRLLVAMQPTRGLDVEATRFVYSRFRAAASRGMAILLFSLDLDEILDLSDRIAVIFNGSLVGVVPKREASADRIGEMMVGAGC